MYSESFNKIDRTKSNKMQDTLNIIDNLIQEHEAIKGHMKSVSALTEDWRGMEWDASTDLNHEQLQALNGKCFNLKQTMDYLDEGLKNHWTHEDNVLAELIGNPLMKSIKIEHDEIKKQVREINLIIDKCTPREFLANRAYLMHIISYLGESIREHEIKEDTILQLLKKQYI